MCSGRAQAVLPLGGAVLPLSTVKTAQRERKHEFLVPSGSSHGSSRGSTAPSGSTAPKSGSKKLHPLQAVVPLPRAVVPLCVGYEHNGWIREVL